LALRNRTVVVAIFAGVLLAACGGGEPAATTEEIAVETELTTDSVSISDLEAQLADQVQSFEALFASGNKTPAKIATTTVRFRSARMKRIPDAR
ncbi:MAG: hypothetical protein AAFQ12_00480, partial [Pseudomonadota bacterium]